MTVDQLDDEVLKLKKERFTLAFPSSARRGSSRIPRGCGRFAATIARIKTIAAQKRSDRQPTAPAPAPRKKTSSQAEARRALESPRRSNQRCRSARSRASW